METFLRDQLERFLEAVDTALAGPVKVVVIGGTAATTSRPSPKSTLTHRSTWTHLFGGSRKR